MGPIVASAPRGLPFPGGYCSAAACMPHHCRTTDEELSRQSRRRDRRAVGARARDAGTRPERGARACSREFAELSRADDPARLVPAAGRAGHGPDLRRSRRRRRPWATASAAVAVGDRVSAAIFPRWIDGRFASSTPTQLGGSLDGMLTEYALLDEDALVRIPDHLSFEEAATLPCAAVTAWNALTGGRGLRSGETRLDARIGRRLAVRVAVREGVRRARDRDHRKRREGRAAARARRGRGHRLPRDAGVARARARADRRARRRPCDRGHRDSSSSRSGRSRTEAEVAFVGLLSDDDAGLPPIDPGCCSSPGRTCAGSPSAARAQF